MLGEAFGIVLAKDLRHQKFSRIGYIELLAKFALEILRLGKGQD